MVNRKVYREEKYNTVVFYTNGYENEKNDDYLRNILNQAINYVENIYSNTYPEDYYKYQSYQNTVILQDIFNYVMKRVRLAHDKFQRRIPIHFNYYFIHCEPEQIEEKRKAKNNNCYYIHIRECDRVARHGNLNNKRLNYDNVTTTKVR